MLQISGKKALIIKSQKKKKAKQRQKEHFPTPDKKNKFLW